MRLAVRIQCTGEAHSNAHIDNCMVCAPGWGKYWACPDCHGKLVSSGRHTVGRLVKVCQNQECARVGEKFYIPEPR